MPMRWFRKHQKKFLAFLAAFLMGSWLVGGAIYNMIAGSEIKDAGKIFGKTIIEPEFNSIKRRWWHWESSIRRNATNEELRNIVTNQYIWEKIMFLHEANRLGITVTDRELAHWIMTLFSGGDQSNFNSEYYDWFLSNQGWSKKAFEETARESLIIQKLQSFIRDSVKVSTEEAQRRYKKENDQLKVKYVALEPKNFADSVKFSAKDMEEFYNEHKDIPIEKNAGSQEYSVGYKEPEKVQIEYVMANYSILEKHVAVTEDEMRKFYEENKDRYKISKPPKPPKTQKTIKANLKKVKKSAETSKPKKIEKQTDQKNKTMRDGGEKLDNKNPTSPAQARGTDSKTEKKQDKSNQKQVVGKNENNKKNSGENPKDSKEKKAKPTSPKYRPFEEVKDLIKKELARTKAKELAKKRIKAANERAEEELNKLYNEEIEKIDFQKIAKEFKLEFGKSEPFSQRQAQGGTIKVKKIYVPKVENKPEGEKEKKDSTKPKDKQEEEPEYEMFFLYDPENRQAQYDFAKSAFELDEYEPSNIMGNMQGKYIFQVVKKLVSAAPELNPIWDDLTKSSKEENEARTSEQWGKILNSLSDEFTKKSKEESKGDSDPEARKKSSEAIKRYKESLDLALRVVDDTADEKAWEEAQFTGRLMHKLIKKKRLSLEYLQTGLSKNAWETVKKVVRKHIAEEDGLKQAEGDQALKPLETENKKFLETKKSPKDLPKKNAEINKKIPTTKKTKTEKTAHDGGEKLTPKGKPSTNTQANTTKIKKNVVVEKHPNPKVKGGKPSPAQTTNKARAQKPKTEEKPKSILKQGETDFFKRPKTYSNGFTFAYIKAFRTTRPEFARVAFNLKKGEVGLAIEDREPRACYLIKVVEWKNVKESDFDKQPAAVKNNVISSILREKRERVMEAWKANLEERANLESNLPLVEVHPESEE